MTKRSYRRRLGQHFLKSRYFAKKIVDFADVSDEVVLEIGAGKGVLTQFIASAARKVFAVEMDGKLAEILGEKAFPNVSVINKNFLDLSLSEYGQLVVVGNIPYSITSEILKKLIKERRFIKRAVLTIQKEYGQRIFARPGSREYGATTLFITCYFNGEKGFTIPPRFFSPPPKVSSVVISLKKRKPLIRLNDEEDFFEFVKGIFRYRRKSIKNCIVHYFKNPPRGLNSRLLQRRPAELTLKDFYQLYRRFKEF